MKIAGGMDRTGRVTAVKGQRKGGDATIRDQIKVDHFVQCLAVALCESRAGPIRKFVCGSQPEKKENDPEKDKKKR